MVKANSTSLRKFNLAATNLKNRRDLDLYDAWIHRLHRINYEKTMFRQSLEYLIRFLLMKRRKKKFSFLKFHSLKRRPQIAPLELISCKCKVLLFLSFIYGRKFRLTYYPFIVQLDSLYTLICPWSERVLLSLIKITFK
jgi:hypothetical protein